MGYRYPRKSKHTLAVVRSSAGLGLKTQFSIPKGDFVAEYFGTFLSDEEADKNGGKYLFEVDKDLVINGTTRGNIARYINHSCRPNCESEIDGKRVFIYAKRNIKSGEELAYDYGKEYFDDFIKPHGCKCAPCKK